MLLGPDLCSPEACQALFWDAELATHMNYWELGQRRRQPDPSKALACLGADEIMLLGDSAGASEDADLAVQLWAFPTVYHGMFEYAANENDDAMRMPMLVKIAKAMVKYYEDCPRWCYCQFTQNDYNTLPIAGWWLTANERPFAEWFVKNILRLNDRLRQRFHLLSYEFYSD